MYHILTFTEPSVKDIVTELKEVDTDTIYNLGIQLDIEASQLATINAKCQHKPATLKLEIIRYWKQNSKKCSWGVLATALEKVGGYKNLVDKLRKLDDSSKSEGSTATTDDDRTCTATDVHTPKSNEPNDTSTSSTDNTSPKKKGKLQRSTVISCNIYKLPLYMSKKKDHEGVGEPCTIYHDA